MSGREDSYVSWSSNNYQSSMQRSQNDYSNRVAEVRRQAEREYQQRLRPIEERQQRFESSLKNLRSNIGQVEREMLQRDRATQKRLQQQRLEFTNQLHRQWDETQHQFQHQRQEYRRLIEEQGCRMTRIVEEEHRQREEAVKHLQLQINQVVDDAARKKEIAKSFVADLTNILEETRRLPHDRFAPGQLDAVQRHIRDARSNLEAGTPEAALSTAQNAYWQLADLRTLVVQKEIEFMTIHQAALEEARTILEEARANRRCEIISGSGNDIDKLELEVDYWTHGDLAALEQEIQTMKRQLVSEEKSLSADAVKDILIYLENARSSMSKIVENARDNIMGSQLRFNVAELVVKALGSQGYDVEAGVYEGNDPRNAYVAKVKNRAGSEVVSVISPMADSCGKSRVSIHSYEETYLGEETRRQRAKNVAMMLSEEGLQVVSPTCMGNADESYRDIAAVAARQPVTEKQQFQHVVDHKIGV